MSQAFPTPISDPHLKLAAQLSDLAIDALREAYRLVIADTTLSIQAETAGKSALRLKEFVETRTKVYGPEVAQKEQLL